ncbi:SpoIIE family protein phosphatase [Streptomyces rubiginosohelvolus]
MNAVPEDRDGLTGDAEVVREVFEELPILVLATEGPDHRVVAVNAAYRASVDRARLVGLLVRELWPRTERQRIFDLLDRAFSTATVQSGHEWRVQIETDSGMREIFFNFMATPRLDATGTVKGLTFTLDDVTEQVRERLAAQERVAEAERRYAEARGMVVALQEALLPSSVPVLPCARVAARYVLAEADTAAGGDWFDTVPLEGGRIGLVVGDVVGHGMAASAVMGQLRTVVRERLSTGAGPATVLAAVDRFTAGVPGAHSATCCVAVLDPATGALVYASAGHPPPLAVTAEGGARYLPPGAGPLGTGASYRDRESAVGEGGMLLLYTDGIIERPLIKGDEGRAVLAESVSHAFLDRAFPQDTDRYVAERALDQVLELLLRDGGHSDDITLLAAHRAPRAADFRVVLPALLSSVRSIQFELARWLVEVGCGEADESALQHAVVELVTNAVEHAYQGDTVGSSSHSVTVGARLGDDGVVHVEVADRGRWADAEHPDPFRGRGLTMAEMFTETLTIKRGDEGAAGTTASITRPLRHPVAVTANSPKPPARTLDLTVEPHLDIPGLLIADGTIDTVTVGRLDDAVMTASRAGTRSVAVDLSGVEHLASAGVQALHRARATLAGHGQVLTLHARPGTVAADVLELADLPHSPRPNNR